MAVDEKSELWTQSDDLQVIRLIGLYQGACAPVLKRLPISIIVELDGKLAMVWENLEQIIAVHVSAAKYQTLLGFWRPLYERQLGGQVKIAARIPYREEIRDVIRYLARQLDKLDVDVHLGKSMTAGEIEELGGDVVIIATGSKPAPADIPGADREHVLSVWDVLLDLKPLGDRIVVQPTGLTTASRYMQQILPFLQAADSGTAIYDRLSK